MKTSRFVGAVLAALATASLCACAAPGFGMPTKEEIRDDVTAALAEEGYLATGVYVYLDGFGHDLKVNVDGGTQYTADDLRTIILASDDAGAGKFTSTSYTFRDEGTGDYQDVCAAFESLNPGGQCRETGFTAGDDFVDELRSQD